MSGRSNGAPMPARPRRWTCSRSACSIARSMMPAETPAVAGFIDKWLQREPAFVQASLFVAPAQRALFAHWGALLFCLREAAFELSEPSLRIAKSGWWAQELLALAQGRSEVRRVGNERVSPCRYGG